MVPSPNSQPVVIIMVKAPRPGAVKTRLTPPLPPDRAASLAAAFAQDVAAIARLVCGRVLVAYAPADGQATLAPLLPEVSLWSEQQGMDLGARMENAMSYAEAQGFGPLVVIGTDSPTLPPSYLQTAFDTLMSGDADMTIGPTDDGGYYLIGTRRHIPGLFDGVAWSTPSACAQTIANAQRLGLRSLSLPPWYDIDTFDDLVRLRNEFKDDESRRLRAPKTLAWLQADPP
jgi:rSAM/selenodomain-associated transferase 1